MSHIIKQITQFHDFCEGECWLRRTFARAEIVVRAGSRDNLIYVVETGCLRVTGNVHVEAGCAIHPGICELGPGDLFGELSLFDDQPRSASVVAIDDVSLIEINGKRLRYWMDSHPDLGYLFLKELFNVQIYRLRHANRRVEHLLAWGLKAHGINQYL